MFPTPKRLVGMKLESCYFPVSFQSIPPTHNSLRVEQLTGTVPLSGTITIPAGNYTSSTYVTAVANALNSASSGFLWTGTWSVSLDAFTSKITITNSGTRQFRLASTSGSMHDILGISLGFESSGSPPSLTGTGIFNLQSVNLINVVSRELGTALADNLHSSFPNSNSILGTIHVTNPFGTFQSMRWHKTGYDFFYKSHSTREVDGFDIALKDEQFRDIDFQGQPWYMEFTFM